jgi:hypothetical protein
MRLSLKDTIFIGFCAVFILTAKALLRLHLKIPGHSMFFTLFFLLIARGCVRHWAAASFCGLLAGIMAVILGMGKGGPLILIKFLLPALMVDLMAGILPGMFQSVFLCALTGGLAASTRMLSTWLIDVLAGMEQEIVLQHMWLQGTGNILFGLAGAIPVPAVIRKLVAHGAIDGNDDIDGDLQLHKNNKENSP